jgi:hypothetical protein
MFQQWQLINQFIKNCKEYIDPPRENKPHNEADPAVRRRRPAT